jgi:hypothetical protein
MNGGNKAVAASSAMFPLVTAQTVAFERGVGGWMRDHRRRQTNEFDQDRRIILYARFPIGTTFPSLRGTRDTTAALARSSKAVAMYFA